MTTCIEYGLPEHERVEFLLGISEASAKRAAKSADAEENGIICVVFAAAAVEAALNLFVTIPLLYIPSKEIRQFYGRIVTSRARPGLQAKLGLAKEFSEALHGKDSLLKSITELFAERNEIVHSPAEYADGAIMPDEVDFSKSDEEIMKQVESVSTIRMQATKLYDPSSLAKYVADAREFISCLHPVSPQSNGPNAP
jgi:hypothetical protein